MNKNTAKKLFFLATFLGAFFCMIYSQKNLGKEADSHFADQEYYLAAGYYKKAYEKEKKPDKKARYLFQMAECYRHIDDLKSAENYYNKAIKAKYPDPVSHLHIAEIKMENKRYDEAIISYKEYQKEIPDSKVAENGIKSCELSQKWIDNPKRYKVDNVAFLNSKENDYSPSFGDYKKYNKIIFTSWRDGSVGGSDLVTGHNHSDMFESVMDKTGKWSTPKSMGEPLDSKFNDGSSCLSKKGDMLLFTRCVEQKGVAVGCHLYLSKKSGPNWGTPEKIPFNPNSTPQGDSLSFRHPCLSPDGNTLYFASNMSGGYGGHDIWKCVYDKKTKEWSEPQNLGPAINTEATDAYPYMHDDGKTLYFSSKGHLGMGGFDLFKAEMGTDGKFTKEPENLQYPMNSPHDDFGIVFKGKREEGYFSSNREGGKGGDDIWSFILPPLLFDLEGFVTDAADGKPVANAIITITGTDGTNFPVKTDQKGHYSTKLAPETSYEVKCETDKDTKNAAGLNYLTNEDKGKLTTVGELASKHYKKDFQLTVATQEIHFPEVLFDLNKWDLRPESKDSLDYLYKVLVANPTIVIELSAHTDSRDGTAYNDTLSNNRARSCWYYLVNEKKINAARIKAKGYGERKLLVTDAEISKVKTKEEKEALHQKNRRTVFKVLSWDYVDPNAPAKPPIVRPKVTGEENSEELPDSEIKDDDK